jgi:hypothetical protein
MEPRTCALAFRRGELIWLARLIAGLPLNGLCPGVCFQLPEAIDRTDPVRTSQNPGGHVLRHWLSLRKDGERSK